MGVTFTVMGDPSRRAALQRGRFVRMLCVTGGMVLLFAFVFLSVKFLTENQSFARSTAGNEGKDQLSDTVMLITATGKIAKGTKLTAQQLREVSWPRDQVPEGALRSFEEAVNMYATASLPENQPLLRTALSPNAPNFGISELLAPGHRAVTIAVNATTGIEGWATAGAHVDVLLTYVDSADNLNKTRVVVENAIVLSFGGNAKAPEENIGRGAPLEISTVTLGVPFQDSLKITTALDMGRISLALRSLHDVSSPGSDSFSADEWDKKRPQKEAPQGPVAKGYAKITGSDGSQKQFVLDGQDRWKDNLAEEFF